MVFKVGVRRGLRLIIRVRGLVVIVRVRVRGWAIHKGYECPNKDRNTRVCES